MKIRSLRTKKPVRGNYKEANIEDLQKEIVNLQVFPLEIDSAYIVIKRVFNEDDIAEHITEISDFLVRCGFEKREYKNRSSLLFRSLTGLDIYIGRNGFHKETIVKIEVRGNFCIFKGYREFIRKIVKDLREILLKCGVNTIARFTRLDIATLIITDDIHSIIPNWEKNKILNLSSMKAQKFFQYDNMSYIPNAIILSNSQYALKAYDKGLELCKKIKEGRASGEYIKYYQDFIDLAESQNKKLFRYELKITNDRDKLEPFSDIFFNTPQATDEGLADILKLFNKFHMFKQQPILKSGEAGDINRTNTGSWTKDPVSNWIMLCHYSKNNIHILKKDATEKIGFDYLQSRPAKIKDLNDEIRLFSKRLVRQNRHPSTTDMKYIVENLWAWFREYKSNIELDIFTNLKRQKAFLLYQSQGSEERKMIERKFDKLIEHYKISANERYYNSTLEMDEEDRSFRIEEVPEYDDDEFINALLG